MFFTLEHKTVIIYWIVNWFIHPFLLNPQNIITPKMLELGTWNLKQCSPPHVCQVSHVQCHVSHVTYCALDRVRKHHLWWNNFYHPLSCSIWSNLSVFFVVEKLLNLFFCSGQLLDHKGPPLWWKNWKYFQMLFLIAQIKHFGTLNATQETTALYKATFLKKSGKNY